MRIELEQAQQLERLGDGLRELALPGVRLAAQD
jgi:hypothetical protein